MSTATRSMARRVRSGVAGVALGLTMVLLLAACGGGGGGTGGGDAGGAATPITITMGTIPTYYTFMPHFVAEGLGLLDELRQQGITLEMVSFQSGADETKALVGGQLDMASSMFTEAAIPMSTGSPVVLTMVYWNGGVSSMLVDRKYTAASLTDLRAELGRPIRVGVTGFGSGTHVAALAKLKNLGLSTADFEIVPVGGIDSYVPSLAQGRVDVVEAGEPATQQLLDQGVGRVIVNGWDAAVVKEAFGEFQADGLHVRKQFLEENPEAVQAVVDALYRAQTFMLENRDNPQAILDVLPDEAKRSLVNVHDNVWARISSVLSEDGCPSIPAAQAVEKSLKDAELIAPDVQVDWAQYQTDRFLGGRCG